MVENNIVNNSEPVKGVLSPYILWIKFSKEAFGLSCIIGSVYLPVGKKYADEEMFDTINDDIFYLKSQLKLPIFLIGDMNSRTGNLDDILEFEKEIISNSDIKDFADDFIDIRLLMKII